MADALTLLRQFTIDGKHIEERDDHIIFGEFSWKIDSLTNFVIYSAENKEKEHYTLGCLLYFLKNEHLSHPKYVQQAAGDKVPVVRRPDRRALLEYLHGQNAQIPKSIDKTARLEMPTHVKRTADDFKFDGLPPAAKRAKLDSKASEQQIKERLAAKLDGTAQDKLSINKANLKNLSEELNTAKIAEIRAKVFSNRRSRVKPEDEAEAGKGASTAAIYMDRSETSTIFNREKQYRTRTTILQSTGKTFSKTVHAILSSIKAREEGKVMKPPQQTPRPGAPLNNPAQPVKTLPNYNRYDQEIFHAKDAHGFNIETTGTFSGMTLRSVTEGNPRNKKEAPKQASSAIKPAASSPASIGQNGSNKSGKRPSRTPIIIISAAPKSLITMFNAKEVLQDLRFVSTEEMKAKNANLKRDNELLIQRRKEGGLTVPYRVIDNPGKLSPQDWDRVVAVFVMGQAWQFKGWPWNGNPTEIFSKICGFHIKWDEVNLEKNIANWAVHTIQLSRSKRHLDRAKLMLFWEILDRYMQNNKPHLRF